MGGSKVCPLGSVPVAQHSIAFQLKHCLSVKHHGNALSDDGCQPCLTDSSIHSEWTDMLLTACSPQ